MVNYLIEGYRSGQTPNPDIMCNRYIKFGCLVDYQHTAGFDALATGHYCQKITHKGHFSIHQGVDPHKDQSFFLCGVRRNQLASVQFPLGTWLKTNVRALAQKIGLPNALRKDSQDICFLGSSRVPINDFLTKYIPDAPGKIVRTDGVVLGEHRGLHRYTIGQRKGIGIASNCDFEHYVVVAKDYRNGTLIVGFDHPETQGLYTTRVRMHPLNFLENPPEEGECVLVKPRYRSPSQVAHWHWIDDAISEITFTMPHRALAVGQIAAFYRQTCLIGGGVYQQIF